MFKIDFFELAFLAEACIPERPIARAMFWHSLTDKYWEQMTPDNQYFVNTFHNGDHHAFMYKCKHYIGRNTWIPKEFIKSKNKI